MYEDNEQNAEDLRIHLDEKEKEISALQKDIQKLVKLTDNVAQVKSKHAQEMKILKHTYEERLKK